MALPASKDAESFKIHQEDPLNAEPDAGKLVDATWRTPEHLQYLRNHGEILHLPREGYRVHVEIEEALKHLLDPKAALARRRQEGQINIQVLLSLGRTSLAAALQCAGNRREEMNSRKEVEGIQWGAGTILNASWEGVLLRNVLLELGVPKSFAQIQALADAHVHFTSTQTCEQADHYEASIPLRDAMDPRRTVMLADKMNGQILPDEHGGPLRVIVPGFIGARSVKWLHTLRISSTPSENFYMTSDYKKLPSFVGSEDKAEWMKKTAPLQETGLQSEIGQVSQNGDIITVKGYALDGKGMAIQAVEVCICIDEDGSRSQDDLVQESLKSQWTAARLEKDDKVDTDRHWAWTLWTADVEIKQGWKGRPVTLLCRASTVAGEKQERLTDWNLRGVETEGYGIYRNFRVASRRE